MIWRSAWSLGPALRRVRCCGAARRLRLDNDRADYAGFRVAGPAALECENAGSVSREVGRDFRFGRHGEVDLQYVYASRASVRVDCSPPKCLNANHSIVST